MADRPADEEDEEDTGDRYIDRLRGYSPQGGGGRRIWCMHGVHGWLGNVSQEVTWNPRSVVPEERPCCVKSMRILKQ